MTQKKKSRMSRGAGGIAVLALAIGLYLGRGFGLGGGPSNQNNGSEGAQGTRVAVVEASLESDGERDGEVTEPVSQDSAPTTLEPPSVLSVLIDGREFYIVDESAADAQPAPVSQQELASRARQTSGDETGVRVKVLRRRTARVSAKAELMELLRDAGLPDEAVYWQKQYVD